MPRLPHAEAEIERPLRGCSASFGPVHRTTLLRRAASRTRTPRPSRAATPGGHLASAARCKQKRREE